MWEERAEERDAAGTPEETKDTYNHSLNKVDVIRINEQSRPRPDLRKQCAGPHPGLLHASHISWTDVV